MVLKYIQMKNKSWQFESEWSKPWPAGNIGSAAALSVPHRRILIIIHQDGKLLLLNFNDPFVVPKFWHYDESVFSFLEKLKDSVKTVVVSVCFCNWEVKTFICVHQLYVARLGKSEEENGWEQHITKKWRPKKVHQLDKHVSAYSELDYLFF